METQLNHSIADVEGGGDYSGRSKRRRELAADMEKCFPLETMAINYGTNVPDALH